MERWTTSRKRRKRYRRQLSAEEASVDRKPPPQGFATGMPITTGDCLSIRRAIKHGWNPKASALRNAPERLVELSNEGAQTGDANKVLAAARALKRMHQSNMQRRDAALAVVLHRLRTKS